MRILVLTGGSSGIGKATVELFNTNGYKVYELSPDGITHDGIEHIDCNVTKPEDCRQAVEHVLAKEGRIDVLICNAGIGISGAVEFTDINEAKRQLDVNFFGAVNITQAALPSMRTRQAGRIIFTSSMASEFPIPFQAFYSASKSAINGFASALANEVRPFGISVCCLLPGDVKTGFTAARAKSNVGEDIYTHMKRAVGNMEHDEQNGITPERMAQKMLALANAKSPCLYNTVGWNYHLFAFMKHLVTATFANRVVGMMYK